LLSELKTCCLSLLFAIALLSCFTTASFAANRVTLTAEPVEVPAGSGSGKTRISWETEDGEELRLFVVKEDSSLVQVGKGRTGEYRENFIFPNQTYEYRLYPADNSDVPLAAVTVVGTRKVNYFPDFQIINQKIFKSWSLRLGIIFLLLFGAGYLARRQKSSKLQTVLMIGAVILAMVSAATIINKERSKPFAEHPEPDAQETMDAARQMFEGNGYVTFYHENKAQPPRYPPSFSIALLPFAGFGEYPTNIMFGAKFFALLYLAMAVFAAWMLGGRMAAMLAAIFVGVSPFAEHYARIVMSETFTASLVLLTVVLLHKPSLKKIVFAGAIVGFLVTVRLQMLVCLPALLLALPTMRQRIWAALSAAPFLLLNGIFNWRTYGGFFTTGYNYWLPNIKSFAVEFAFRAYPQGDGPWIIPDLLHGWLMVWICPCEKGGTLAALPNIIFYPLVLLGVFWIFAPPFVPLYGLWTAWKSRREPAAKFTLWLSGFSILLFTFYFYQAARFMAATSTLLLLFAAVKLGKKLQQIIQSDALFDSAPHSPETQASADKNFSN
jgi:hypothetical protein